MYVHTCMYVVLTGLYFNLVVACFSFFNSSRSILGLPWKLFVIHMLTSNTLAFLPGLCCCRRFQFSLFLCVRLLSSIFNSWLRITYV